ncbi:MAG: DUF4340 domain-containing protein [Bacteroidetes bacterium]|nr:DUF4340 domain-containing protein [Bacteroidota bacterium]
MKKSTIILLSILGILILVAILVLQKPGEKSVTKTGTPMFSIDSAAVSKVQIQSLNSKIVLEKQGADWFVVEPIKYKADQSAVARLIQQMKNVVSKGIVSDKPEKHGIFRVDSTGLRVTLWQKENEVADCIIGKMAQTYTESFVRKGTGNEVYIAEGIMEYQVPQDVKSWRDRTIASAIRENIKSVTYQYGDTLFTLSFQDSVWMVGNDKAQESVVQSVLGALINVQADDFADSLVTFPKPTAMVSYTGLQLQFAFDKEQKKYFVRTSQSPQIFVVEQWRADQILKRKKDFLAK